MLDINKSFKNTWIMMIDQTNTVKFEPLTLWFFFNRNFFIP